MSEKSAKQTKQTIDFGQVFIQSAASDADRYGDPVLADRLRECARDLDSIWPVEVRKRSNIVPQGTWARLEALSARANPLMSRVDMWRTALPNVA
jgi:hypothetical protein